MGSDYVIKALKGVGVPGSAPARERAVAAARGAYRPRAGGAERGRRLVIAVAAMGVLAALSFTPPGRALAERVGELVGIGEPSSVTETNLRDPRLNQQEPLGPVLIAASGTIPDTDQSFEIVAWAARKKLPVLSPKEQDALRALSRLEPARRRDLSPADRRAFLEQTARVINLWRTKLSEAERQDLAAFMRARQVIPVEPARGSSGLQLEKRSTLLSCLGIVYPELGSQETGKWCAEPSMDVDELTKPVHVFGLGPMAPEDFGPDAPYEIVGVTEPEVQRVGVTYVDKNGSRVNAPVTLGRMDEELLQETGADYPFGFFVAFIPYDGAPRPDDSLSTSPALQSVHVTAYDPQGRVLGHDN